MLKIESKETNGVNVRISPQFIPNEIAPDGSKYYFAYTIEIENKSDVWLKLISRKWVIINAEGNTEVVEGEGVVGLKPELEAKNGYFRYTSFCPMDTTWGTMEGQYTMVDKIGNIHLVDIPRFYLIVEDSNSNSNSNSNNND